MKSKNVSMIFNQPSAAGQVRVYRLEETDRPASFPHIRRDFYKIELLSQVEGVLGYAAERVTIQDSALIFVNPLVPYSWQRTAGRETGYVCLFTDEFITPSVRTGPVAGSALFRVGAKPVLFPAPDVVSRLNYLFEQLLAELQSDYVNKYDLMRNYVQLIIHESLKIVPAQPDYQPGTSAARITSVFMELLYRQFPVDSPEHTLHFKNANEFASHLGISTNHLNKALKETTGQTTTRHIAEKIAEEASALLRHSDWTLAEIGYCLGFEHASNFNSFYKKMTGQSPNYYRRQLSVNS